MILNPHRFGSPPVDPWVAAVNALAPIMWLRLDEAAGNFVDASGNGHDGTPNNTPSRSQTAIYENMGLCAGFAATNKSVSVASTAALRLTGDFTIAVAIKRNGAQGTFAKLFWKPTDYANGRHNYGFEYIASTNKILARVNASSSYYDATCTTTIADATPYWIVQRRLGTEMSIWVNGIKEATATLPGGAVLDTSADAIYIGGQSNNANDQFTGTLDEPMVFDYGLSDTEIQDLYAARQMTSLPEEILARAPWAYYRLDEAAGAGTYVDSSGNARDLTAITATVTAGAAGIVVPGTATDFAGGYIRSQSDEFGAAQAAAFDGDKALTVIAVIRGDSFGGTPVLFHIGALGAFGSQGFFFCIDTNGGLRFQFFDDTGGSYKSLSTAAGVVSTGTTYVVTCRRAVGGACEIFVNDTSVGTATLTGTIAAAPTGSSGGARIAVGVLTDTAPSNAMDGKMQHVAVFASALSNADISAIVAASGL